MKPAPFDYVRAESLAEAHDVLAAEGGDAAVIAGGQSLVPLLSMRMARPKVLIDIMHIAELDGIAMDNNTIRVSARVRQAELLAWPDLAVRQPLLAQAMPWIGHWQTRSRGTVCGSIALADPSAELPLCLLALGGEVTLSSKQGRRSVEAGDFFTGLMSTARRDDELIEQVSFPCRRPGEGFAFREFARRHGDFAIVACAAVATEKSVQLAVSGVADRPVVRDFDDASDAALAAFASELDTRDDLHATAEYRRMLVRELGRQTIEEARRCRA
ncbi:MAG: carbon monoxide dehydrogenase [Alphaproteobacteria bacterium]|nr:MAG: carbon monoxide dehydrogenase [Alphaproteobacteria bacterium]